MTCPDDSKLSIVGTFENGNRFTQYFPLTIDVNDGPASSGFFALVGADLQGALTDEQEALFGCGRFFGTSCDVDGIDPVSLIAYDKVMVTVDAVKKIEEWLG